MKNKIISYSSYGFLLLGAALGIYVFVNIFISGSKLPAGVCPVTNNRPLIYTAIAFCCISFILTLFEGKNTKKSSKNEQAGKESE